MSNWTPISDEDYERAVILDIITDDRTDPEVRRAQALIAARHSHAIKELTRLQAENQRLRDAAQAVSDAFWSLSFDSDPKHTVADLSRVMLVLDGMLANEDSQVEKGAGLSEATKDLIKKSLS